MADKSWVLLASGLLVIILVILFMYKVDLSGGVLAVVVGDVGDITAGEEKELNVNIELASDSQAIDSLKVRYELYGPDASLFPCKEAVWSPEPILYGNSIQPGDDLDVSVTLPDTLTAGDGYQLLVYVYDGSTQAGLVNSAYDNNLYETCYNENKVELEDIQNGCGKDADGRYYYCLGASWEFDVVHAIEENDTCLEAGCPTNYTCNSTTGLCDQIVPVIIGVCNSTDVYKFNCSDNKTVINLYNCINNSWVKTNQTCPSVTSSGGSVGGDAEFSVVAVIFVIAGVGIVYYVGRKKRWF